MLEHIFIQDGNIVKVARTLRSPDLDLHSRRIMKSEGPTQLISLGYPSVKIL